MKKRGLILGFTSLLLLGAFSFSVQSPIGFKSQVKMANKASGTISFGSNDVKINSGSVSGKDSLNNTWNITTVGTTSYTANSAYYQVGSSSKPATSITFTTKLEETKSITSFSAKFGGFSGTAGTVTLKVGTTTVGTGSLNASTDVYVTNSSASDGNELTVTVTSISKGVKVYEIAYTYEDVEPSVPKETVQENLNSIDPYFSLGYKYEAVKGTFYTLQIANDRTTDDNSALNASGVAGSISSMPAGITISSVEKIYAGQNSTLKFGTSSAGGSITFSCTNSISKVLITASEYKPGEDGFDIRYGNDKALANSYNADGEEVVCTFAEAQSIITISSHSRLRLSKIVFIGEGDELSYTNVDLRFKVALDDMTDVTGVSQKGIEVKTDSKTKQYNYNNLLEETKLEKVYKYQVITLGDVINNANRLTDEFTIRAYVVYGSETLYSTSEKTYSVVDLVKEYFSNDDTTEIVKPFYNLLVSMGYIS